MFLFFLRQRKGTAECSAPGGSGKFSSYSLDAASLSVCEGSFVAWALPGAHVFIVAALLTEWTLFTQNLQVLSFGRGAQRLQGVLVLFF